MLIRRPVEEVFAAYIDPAITTKFWFTKSSGRLDVGQEVRWEWEMYGVGTTVRVVAINPNERILIEWDDPPCPVEWKFASRGELETLVEIRNWGFHGAAEEVQSQALDALGGFNLVLAGLKAWLEHGIQLNVVRDHFPDAWVGTE
jgi:uncharacterized protein YndB with AHSA1/START domain